jgi:hypothetical protein
VSSLRTAAVRYTTLGYGVVPLHWIRDDKSCSCGNPNCTKPGKHPITEHGASDPILDPETATRQWDKTPNANIGLVAGVARWLILDIDGPDARKRFASIADEATLEAVRRAPTQKTGKGWHIIFRDDTGEFGPSTGKNDDKGIDIRAGVSYILAEPSNHVSGATYTWTQHPPPFEPEAATPWFRAYVQERGSAKNATIIDQDVTVNEGSRNSVLTELGGSMRRRGFNEEEMRAALLAANQRINKPPLSEREVASIARSLSSYEPSDVPKDIIAASVDTSDLINRLNALDTRTLVEENPPPIDWVWEDWMAPGTLNMLHGDGGLGKSYLSLKIAEQMLRETGGELFGKTIHPGGVIILDGENAESQIHHRIHNTTITADANLKIYTVTEAILGFDERTTSLFGWLAEQHDPRLIIIDSQRALWGGDEKEQMEAGIMLRKLARGLEDFPFATLLLHHDNRGGDFAGSSDVNAAISGARFHIVKHHDKSQTQARRITMPKNRIGPEMPPNEFTMTIDTQPRSLRSEVSGIQIRKFQSGAEQEASDLIDQILTMIHNAPPTQEEIWAALGWEYADRKPKARAHRDVWEQLVVMLEQRGYKNTTRAQAGITRGDGRQRVWVRDH